MGYPPSRNYFELAGACFGSPRRLIVILRHAERRQHVEPCVWLAYKHNCLSEFNRQARPFFLVPLEGFEVIPL
jgi:hypothetical protein